MIDEVREDAPRKRADARRSIAAILDAATRCLAKDPDASVNEIAKVAGVGRMTLYGHFPSRSALVADVVQRALAISETELSAVDLRGDPRAAMERLLAASLSVTYRFGGLVQAAEQALPPPLLESTHTVQIERAKSLLRRGRREGVFRRDQPLEWQVTVIQSLLHAAATGVHQQTIDEARAPTLVAATALAAIATPAESPPSAATRRADVR